MLEDIIQIAKEAGEIIRENFGKNFNIEFKSSESNLVTEVDKKSEKLIIDFVNKKYPSHSILSEEIGNIDNSSEYKWVIDPLDGTTNFAHSLPIFAVSIGVMKGKEIIAGAVYDIMRDIMYSAEKGSGSFLNKTQKLSVSKNDNLRKSFLVTGFPYNIEENPDNTIELFISFLKKVRAVRRLGSAAIDLCYVANGVFDGFWEVHLNPWDICAGKLILEEAGGKVTDFNGNEIDIFSKKFLSSNGYLHKEMLNVIQETLNIYK